MTRETDATSRFSVSNSDNYDNNYTRNKLNNLILRAFLHFN